MVTTNFVNCGFVCPTKAVKEFLWWAYRTDASHFLNRTFLTARLERVAIFLLYFWKATLYKGGPKVLRLGQFFRSVFSVFEQNSVLSFSSLISLHFFLFSAFGFWFFVKKKKICREKFQRQNILLRALNPRTMRRQVLYSKSFQFGEILTNSVFQTYLKVIKYLDARSPRVLQRDHKISISYWSECDGITVDFHSTDNLLV